jgi:Family of unknown function (DUF6600)
MKFAFVTALLALAAMDICAPQRANAQTQLPTPNTDLISTASDDSMTSGTLPSDVAPNSPLAQVIRLAQSGVDASVILSYVNNSSSPFNLTSDQIIYLKDLGLPNDVVTAMIQRDQQLGAAENTATVTTSESDEQTEVPAQPADVTQNYFYDTLSPYGGWVNIEGYGLCWRPTIVVYDSSWQPYCDHGHWIYTDSGWYWVSDYSWGATAFHYGRWFHNPRYGWCWWPDTTWAPSWVTWRYANDYCGWAPLPPHTIYQPGVGIVYNGVVVGAGFNFGIAVNFFTFVPTRNFCDSHPRHYRVTSAQAAEIYRHSTIIHDFNFKNHAIVNDGISPQHITAASGVQIHPVRIETTTASPGHGAPGERFGQNGQTLIVHRPQFQQNAAESLNRGIRPHSTIPNRNNFSQPIVNQNSQPRRNESAPQNSPPEHSEISHTATREPQTRDNISTPESPATHSSPTPTPNHNNDTRYVSPKMQQSHHETPHAVTPTEHNEPSHAHSASEPSGTQKSDKDQNQDRLGH